MTVCRGSQRVRNLIESEGMTVDLRIMTYNTEVPDGVFLIKYEGWYKTGVYTSCLYSLLTLCGP